MDPADDRRLQAVIAEQRRYYAARASEYDDAYEGTESWRGEMAQLEAAFDRVEFFGDAIELAAGTGVWSERIVDRVQSLTVVDASPEMLAEHRRRLGTKSRAIVYEVTDLFTWRPVRTWNTCVFAFWL